MSQRGVVMSRLDEIRRKGFTRTSTIVEVEDCEVLNWNKELLIKDSKRSFYSTYKVLPFANWLVSVETVNIESLEDKEITVLFDKYCLYAVNILTQKLLKSKACYTDTILYCESQKKKYTEKDTRSFMTNVVKLRKSTRKQSSPRIQQKLLEMRILQLLYLRINDTR